MADEKNEETPDDPEADALRSKVTQRQIMMGVAAGVVSGLLIAAGSLFYNPPDLDPAPEGPSQDLTDALDSIDRALLDAGVDPGEVEPEEETDPAPPATDETAGDRIEAPEVDDALEPPMPAEQPE
jgi:hypothetical protein